MGESERKVLYYTSPVLNWMVLKGLEWSLLGGSMLRGEKLSSGMTNSGAPSLVAPSVRAKISSLMFLIFLFVVGTSRDPLIEFQLEGGQTRLRVR